MKYIIILTLLLSTSICFAEDKPDMDKAINDRIILLEKEKETLEKVYMELTIRIDELKKVIAPKEEKTEDAN